MGIGAIIGSIAAPMIGGIIGGELDRKADRQAESRERQQQDLINQRNYDMQKEFATMGIRWRAEDAREAGLHPLAAIGANVTGASPSFQMNSTPPPRTHYRETFGEMGQNINRAINATLTAEEKAAKHLQLEGLRLDNAYKQKLIEGMDGPSTSSDPNLLGVAGQAQSSVIDTPLRRVAPDLNDPSKEIGAISDFQIVRTKNGYAVVPGQGVKQAIEDSPMEYQWLLRAIKREYRLPDGRTGFMNPFTGEITPKSALKEFNPIHHLKRGFKRLIGREK